MNSWQKIAVFFHDCAYCNRGPDETHNSCSAHSGTTAKTVFAGSPIIDSYNGSVTMGIAIPLDRILRTNDK